MLCLKLNFSLLSHLAITRTITFSVLLALTPYVCTKDSYAGSEQQNSTRIEVYSLSQNYWDTQYSDTLGGIVLHLLPNNPAKHQALIQDIVQLNPDAFINGNPDQLLANKRLWLPGYMKQADTKTDPSSTTVERYSWGNIKRAK